MPDRPLGLEQALILVQGVAIESFVKLFRPPPQESDEGLYQFIKLLVAPG